MARRYDAIYTQDDGKIVGVEVKTGYGNLMASQIASDSYLAAKIQVDGVLYVFVPNPNSGKTGPPPDVAKMLTDANIDYIVLD